MMSQQERQALLHDRPARWQLPWIGLLVTLAVHAPLARAQVVEQVTDVGNGPTSLGHLDDDGTAVFAISASDPLGTNSEHVHEIFKWDPDTGAVSQLSTFEEGVEPALIGPSVSDDGQKLLFVSRGNLTRSNPDRSHELFVMNADGTGLLQLTDAQSPADGTIWMYQISGNGSRAVFSATFDYLDSNPDGFLQLYVVDTDGMNLRQLTQTHQEGSYLWPSISDGGQRIAFQSFEDLAGTGRPPGWYEIYGIDADGSSLRQLTDLRAFSFFPQISGDGSVVAFQTDFAFPGELCDGGYDQAGWDDIAAVDWEGTEVTLVHDPCLGAVFPGSSQLPDVMDDGTWIFFGSDDLFGGSWEIWKAAYDNSDEYPLTEADGGPGAPADCRNARVSGSGNRVAFGCSGGEPFGGSNPDHGFELYAMTGEGTGHRQLSDGRSGDSQEPDIAAYGSRIVFVSNADPTDDGPSPRRQVYRIAPGGTDLLRLTSFGEGEPQEPAISDDGSTVVFAADSDPFGTNPERTFQIFLVQADGTGLKQLTPGKVGETGPSVAPAISGDGSLIVFQSDADLIGENPGGTKLFKVNPDGGGLTQLTDGFWPRVDGSGTWLAFHYNGSVFRMRTDGTEQQELTAGWSGSSLRADIAAGGDRIAFESSADPQGSNPEGNVEIFLWEASTDTATQLTETGSGDNERPAISGDGRFVYFSSTSPWFEDDPVNLSDYLRVEVATGIVERVEALEPCPAADDPRPIAVNQDGALAVFAGGRDCTGDNPDGGLELFLIDRNRPARIRVSRGSNPTVVSWDVVSGPVRYDVIRGDVASLALAGDGTVDLGAVVCLENESHDTDTSGFEDAAQPGSGQVFFYLYRGTQGADDGPGSYGRTSTGEERVPASGDCPG